MHLAIPVLVGLYGNNVPILKSTTIFGNVCIIAFGYTGIPDVLSQHSNHPVLLECNVLKMAFGYTAIVYKNKHP